VGEVGVETVDDFIVGSKYFAINLSRRFWNAFESIFKAGLLLRAVSIKSGNLVRFTFLVGMIAFCFLD